MTMLEKVEEVFPNTKRYRTYAQSWEETGFWVVQCPLKSQMKEDIIITRDFLLFIPWPNDIHKYKDRHDIIAFSQVEVRRLADFRKDFTWRVEPRERF
jgi:hypothetical protein